MSASERDAAEQAPLNSAIVYCDDEAHNLQEWAPKLKRWRCKTCKRLVPEARDLDTYTAAALKRGRPDVRCSCTDCVCELHAYTDRISAGICIWCRNGQHGGGRAW